MTSFTDTKPRVYGEETEYGSTFVSVEGKAHRLTPNQLQHMIRHAAVSGDYIMNAGRMYEDRGHIEYATPECLSVRDIVTYSKAGEQILQQLAKETSEWIEKRSQQRVRGKVRFFRHNADTNSEFNKKNSRQNTFGCHENYSFDPVKLHQPRKKLNPSIATISPEPYAMLVPRSFYPQHDLPLVVLYNHLLPFLISRFIWQGSGNLVYKEGKQTFQLSARIPHLQALANTSTTEHRGIFHWRDEPHARNVGRLHVICGDANRSEYQTYLKFGTTAIVIALIEEGYAFDHLHLRSGLLALHALNRNLNVHERYAMAAGRPMSHLEIQRQYLETAKNWAQSKSNEEIANIINTWEETLTMLDQNDPALEQRLDWVVKRSLLHTHAAQRACSTEELAQINLQYHDIDPEKSIYQTLVNNGMMDTLISEKEISAAVMQAPKGSRARTRQEVLAYLEECKDAGIQICAKRVYWDNMLLELQKNGKTYKFPLGLTTPYDTTHEAINKINQFITRNNERLPQRQ